MQGLYVFLLKSLAVSGIMLGYYWIALRNKRFHFYNRFYLISVLVLSIVLPAINLDWIYVEETTAIPLKGFVAFVDQPVLIAVNDSAVSWEWYLFLTLLAISALLLITFGLGIFGVYQLKRKSKVTSMDRFDFIETNHEDAPFSFFRNLFWKSATPLDSEVGQQVLKHELVHMQQGHTWDKLLVGFLSGLFWVNPFLWIIKRELEVVHEFIADERSIEGADSSLLASMLLESHFQDRFLTSSQSFFYSSIKRRITMISTSTKTSYNYMRRMLVLPIAAGIVLMSSFTMKHKVSANPISSASKLEKPVGLVSTDTTPAPTVVKGKWSQGADGKEYTVKMIGKWAVFFDPKTQKELFRIPKSQLAPPPPPAVVKGYKISDSSKKLEVVVSDVVGGSPVEKYKVVHGKPLSEDNSSETVTNKEITVVGHPRPRVIDGEKISLPEGALFILEGKEISAEEMKGVDQKTIESINVINGSPSLVQKYGAKAANGIIMITLKKN